MRQDRIQSALFRISEAVHAADDLDSLYRHIHAIIQTLMRAENFYIAVVDPAAGLISFPYFADKFEHRAPGRRAG